VDDHPFAIDVAHLEERRLGTANAGSVENDQDGAMHQVRRGFDHAGDFLGAEHGRQLPRRLWKDQIVVSDITPFQGLLVEKPQG
jgi:hypothetical protein